MMPAKAPRVGGANRITKSLYFFLATSARWMCACQTMLFSFQQLAMRSRLLLALLLIAAAVRARADEDESFGKRLRAASKLTLTYTGEGFANLRGGIRRGAIYEGLLEADWDFNLSALGWKNATLHASALSPHGSSLTQGYVGD